MNNEQAQVLGALFKQRRLQRGLTTRALAARCHLNMATIVRLEQGALAEPRPETLKAVAAALELPLADVFADADYVLPSELPSFSSYLRARYRELPAEAITELERVFARFASQHDRYGGETP